jgi:transitional endoplasmic reticulum ATPase
LESRKAILKTYLRNIEELLDEDIQIEDLAKKTQYYVGADLDALIGEVKVIVMDEIIQGIDAGEIDEISINRIKISKKHFTTALEQMRGSLDSTDFEKYEQKSWDLLYAQGKREILYEAVNLINQVEYLKKKGSVDTDIIRVSDNIRNQIYWQKKSFDEIKKSLSELKRLIDIYLK